MGFKSSLAIAQTTRFKRKLPNACTPPATRFNNTSSVLPNPAAATARAHCSSPTKHLRFDQYGSMNNMITSSFAAPATIPTSRERIRISPATSTMNAHKTGSALLLDKTKGTPILQKNEFFHVSQINQGLSSN